MLLREMYSETSAAEEAEQREEFFRGRNLLFRTTREFIGYSTMQMSRKLGSSPSWVKSFETQPKSAGRQYFRKLCEILAVPHAPMRNHNEFLDFYENNPLWVNTVDLILERHPKGDEDELIAPIPFAVGKLLNWRHRDMTGWINYLTDPINQETPSDRTIPDLEAALGFPVGSLSDPESASQNESKIIKCLIRDRATFSKNVTIQLGKRNWTWDKLASKASLSSDEAHRVKDCRSLSQRQASSIACALQIPLGRLFMENGELIEYVDGNSLFSDVPSTARSLVSTYLSSIRAKNGSHQLSASAQALLLLTPLLDVAIQEFTNNMASSDVIKDANSLFTLLSNLAAANVNRLEVS